MKKYAVTAAVLTLLGLGFRVYIALKLPNDAPDDGRAYAQLARNLLDHHVYSTAPEPPYLATYDRVPGYPLFLAGIYRIFGRDNNKAVRLIQAAIATTTCWIAALVAFFWSPRDWSTQKKRRAFLLGLALAVVSPFTSIYVGTVLTEICAMFFEALCVLTASVGLVAQRRKTKILAWTSAGAAGGLATMFRPDAAMFVGSAGLTLVIILLSRAYFKRRSAVEWKKHVAAAFGYGLALTAGFVIAMAPWTIRNARVFKVFQPVAPVEAAMPDEFVPYGYIRWLRTWVDDIRYVDSLEWNVDYRPIHLNQIPDYAFDSPEEKSRVAVLLDKYNNEKPGTEASGTYPQNQSADDDDDDDSGNAGDTQEDDAGHPIATGSIHVGADYNVEMTPEIDAEFGKLAGERIARHPLRFYFTVRLKRAVSLWFDTHSQYWPFDGELFPLSKLDKDLHQQYWLPLFMLLTYISTGLGLWGCWVLLKGKETRIWVLFLLVMIVPRLAFVSTLENPEPRYTVELFPFVSAFSAIALATVEFTRFRTWLRRRAGTTS